MSLRTQSQAPSPTTLATKFRAWRAVQRGRTHLRASTSRDGAAALAEAALNFASALHILGDASATRLGIEAMLLLSIVHDRLAERHDGLRHLDASAALSREALSWNIADKRLRARLLGSFATTLVRRGERTGEMAPLLQAIDIYRSALALLGRTLHPASRAILLAGLGTALVRVAERKIDIQVAHDAVATLEKALRLCSRRSTPAAWASIQNTLSTAQARLAERNRDEELLLRSANGLRLALQERRRDTTPIGWAATMTDLGNVLVTLGDLRGEPSHREEAMRCFRSALEELPLQTSPRDFAETQMNIAALLRRSGDQQSLTEALSALDAAQLGVTRIDCPLDWSMAELVRAQILLDIGHLQQHGETLKMASDAVKSALSVLSPEIAAKAHDQALYLDRKITKSLETVA